MIYALRSPAGPDLALARVTSTTETAGAEESGFLSLLGQIAGDAVASVKQAESLSLDSVNGTASVQQVVDSLMNAERNLQVATMVRDKVVSAYQEFARMPI